jgi:hypothetical protein
MDVFSIFPRINKKKVAAVAVAPKVAVALEP